MKTLIILLISSLLLFGAQSAKKGFSKLPVSTCYGRTPCTACSNCSACKYCSNGGTCGICVSKPAAINLAIKAFKAPSKSAQYTGQCKALTKKGLRCKRSSSGNGFCWQHNK